MIALTISLCAAMALAPSSSEPGSTAIATVGPSSDQAAVLDMLTSVPVVKPRLADSMLETRPTPVVTSPVARVGRKRWWVGLATAQHSAAAFDAWSTRASITSGKGQELDPFMKPFANSGAIYAAIQLAPLATDYIAARMMRSHKGFVRKLWWLPQSVTTAGYMVSGVRNMHVASR